MIRKILSAVAVTLLLAFPLASHADYNPNAVVEGGGPAVAIHKPINALGGSQIVSNTAITSGGTHLSNGTDTQRTYRTNIYFPEHTYDVRLCFGNYVINGSFQTVGSGNPITIDAALEYNGVTVPATFYGQSTFVLASNAKVCTDPIALDIPAGGSAYARSSVLVTSGGYWPLTVYGSATSSYGNNGTDSTTGTGALANGSEGSYAWAPVEVHGTTYPLTSDAVCLIGDSIIYGNQDIQASYVNANAPTAQAGFAVRGLGGYLTASPHNWILMGVPATTEAQHVMSANNALISSIYSGCAYAIDNAGINDVTSGTSAANIEGYITTMAGYFAARGISYYHTTLEPNTSSSNGWATAAGQTPGANESVRVAVNSWLRAGQPGINVIETANTVECNSSNVLTQNGGRWCVGGTALASGTATGGSTYSLTDTSQSWTTNQWQGYVVLITAGTDASEACTIVSNNSNTLQCDVSTFGAAPTGTSTYQIGDVAPSLDGIHPNPQEHIKMAVPVAAAATGFVGH